MYPVVEIKRGKVTQKWRDQAFAPLWDYLQRERPVEAEKIIGYLMFMGNNDKKFYYKNQITRHSIIFDQSGSLVWLDERALEYQFEWDSHPKRKSAAPGPEQVHPNVRRWMETMLSRKMMQKYKAELCVFLQEVWGPMCNYDFSDLTVSYPLGGRKTSYCLYIYPSKFDKLVAFQFPGDEIIEGKCSPGQYRNYRKIERDLKFEGWQVCVYWREHLESDPDCLADDLRKFIQLAQYREPTFVLTPEALKLFK